MKQSYVALATLLVVLTAAGVAHAQVGGANVGGTVTDDTGAALPGVTITFTNKASGFVSTSVTGERGNYRVVALPPAPYEIRAELAGFGPILRQVVLTVGADATVDFKLGVAALSESLTVVGETPLVEVNKSQPSSVITSQQIDNLPVLARNFQVLAQLLPGAKPANIGGLSLTSTVTNFGGVADPRNGFTTIIDGGTVDDAIWGSPVINMGQDAIQEFKVYRNQFDAQYGAALAAVVTVVTKSGANRRSGSGFYFGRDKSLNAINANATSLPQPPFNQVRVGGSFGGAIVQNKTHFFTAIEHLKINTASITNLPDANPFKAIEDGVFPTYTRSDNADARVDHRFGNAHSTYVRYAFDDQIAHGAIKPERLVDGMMLGPNTTNDTSRSHSVVFEEDWIQSPATVNTFRVHYLQHQVATVPNTFTLAVSRTSASWGQSGIAPQYFPRKVLTFSDTWFLTTARHNVKVGGDFVVGRYTFQAHFNEHGSFVFQTNEPFNPNDSRTWPFSFTQQKPGDRNYNSNEVDGYIQDDWRVHDRVRVNLGLRYDLNTNLRNNEFYDDLLGNPAFTGIDRFVSSDRGNDYSAIQPRIGGTWDVSGRGSLVVRAGTGLYVTRNRPWFQMTSQDMIVGSTVVIQDPQQLRFYPDINAVLGGRDLDAYIAAGNARALYLISNDSRLPRQATATAGVGWQISPAVSLDADWVRAHAWDQLGSTDLNVPATGAISASNPRPFPRFSRVTEMQNFTKSWYDALEAQVRTRVRGGNTLQASYTWSRALLDGVDFYSTRRGTERTPQEYGYNSTDRTHNISVSMSSRLPYDIQISIIGRYLSGTPIGTVSAGVDLDGDGSATSDRPAGLPPRVGRGDVETQLLLINKYRASIALAPVTIDALELQPYKDIDLRLTKSLRFGANRRVQVFLEAFNLLNNVTWSSGSGNMRSPTFLVKQPGASAARQIQWGARYTF
jgi:hypothetical protein